MVGGNILEVFLAIRTMVGGHILEVLLAVLTVVGANILGVRSRHLRCYIPPFATLGNAVRIAKGGSNGGVQGGRSPLRESSV